MLLTDMLKAQREEKDRREQKDKDTQDKMAAIYDWEAAQHKLDFIPHMALPGALFGTIGTYHFRDLSAEQILRLIAAFPPAKAGVFKDNCTSIRPSSTLPAGWETTGRASFTPVSGVYLDLSRHGTEPESSFCWYHDAGGDLVRFDSKLKNDYGITPQIDANVQRDIQWGRDLIKVTDCKVNLNGLVKVHPKKVMFSKHSDDSFNQFYLYTEEGEESLVMALLVAINARQKQKQERMLASYEHDKKFGVAVPEHARVREPYESRRLRAGTKAQTELLESAAAAAEWELAQKHWPLYCEEHSIPPERSASHFTWAVHYLKRFDLDVDPNGPGGKPYKYGSGWI